MGFGQLLSRASEQLSKVLLEKAIIDLLKTWLFNFRSINPDNHLEFVVHKVFGRTLLRRYVAHESSNVQRWVRHVRDVLDGNQDKMDWKFYGF